MIIVPRSFYERSSLEVAPDLLGLYLVHNCDNDQYIGRIVEVEAYMGITDKAAHSYNNLRTTRNEVMYGEAGYAYIYLIYGMYYCVNVVCAEVGNPQAVLIRAVEPIKGFDKMAFNRYNKPYDKLSLSQIYNLTSGPGKLCQAMNITKANYGDDLTNSSLLIYNDNKVNDYAIATSPRINIDYAQEAKDYPWRFYLKDNPYVSKVKKNQFDMN